MEIFLHSSDNLDQLAQKLRERLNIPELNRWGYHRFQRRADPLTGRLYYLFETVGLQLELHRHEGQIPDRIDFPYYLSVSSEVDTDKAELGAICRHLALVLNNLPSETAVSDYLPSGYGNR